MKHSRSQAELRSSRRDFILKMLFNLEEEAPQHLKQSVDGKAHKSVTHRKAGENFLLPALNQLTPKISMSAANTPHINHESVYSFRSALKENSAHKRTTTDISKSSNTTPLRKIKYLANQQKHHQSIEFQLNEDDNVAKRLVFKPVMNSVLRNAEQPPKLKSDNNYFKSMGEINDLMTYSNLLPTRTLCEASLQDIGQFEEFLKTYQAMDQPLFEGLRASEKSTAVQYKGGFYYGRTVNSTREGRGIMFYSSGKIYEGEWHNGQKSGHGIEKTAEGHIYQGEFSEGKPHGQGVYQWKDGDVYEGEFVRGLKHGKGTWRNSAGVSYIGQWIDGRAEGQGIHTWQNGDRYEGEFKDSLKHGKGVEKFANKDMYIGSYENGKSSGYGEYYWSNGSHYKGNFKEGLREGDGFYKNSNSEQYRGQYKADKKNGYGEFIWASGNVYKGNFADDLREGQGEMMWTDGSFYRGEWVGGIQNGLGELMIPNKSHVKGMFKNNVLVDTSHPDQKLVLPHLNLKSLSSEKGSATTYKHSRKKDLNIHTALDNPNPNPKIANSLPQTARASYNPNPNPYVEIREYSSKK